MAEETKKKSASIHERIFNIQSAIEGVKKGGENTFNKYKYSREVDMITSLKPLMIKEKVGVYQTTKSFTKTDKMSRVEVEFTLYSVDKPEDKVVEIFFGEGEDKAGSVVGTPIAYTMALKYFLAKTFIVETYDDAELDKKKGAGKNETVDQKFEKAKKWIEGARTEGALIEYSEKLKESKNFDKKQVAELQALITAKVDSFENQDGK